MATNLKPAIRIIIILLFISCKNGTYLPYPVYLSPSDFSNVELYFNEHKIDSFKLTLNKFERISYCIEIFSDNIKYYLFWYNFGNKIDISDFENNSSTVHEKLIKLFCYDNNINKDIQKSEIIMNSINKSNNIFKSIQVVNINNKECFLKIEIIYEHNYIQIYSIFDQKNINEALGVFDEIKFRRMNIKNKLYKDPIPQIDSRFE